MQGHIRKRVHTNKNGKTSTTWYVIIDLPRGPEGKRRQKWHGGYRTRRDAEAARAKIVHEYNTGTYVEANAITLAEWVTHHWLPTVEGRGSQQT